MGLAVYRPDGSLVTASGMPYDEQQPPSVGLEPEEDMLMQRLVELERTGRGETPEAVSLRRELFPDEGPPEFFDDIGAGAQQVRDFLAPVVEGGLPSMREIGESVRAADEAVIEGGRRAYDMAREGGLPDMIRDPMQTGRARELLTEMWQGYTGEEGMPAGAAEAAVPPPPPSEGVGVADAFGAPDTPPMMDGGVADGFGLADEEPEGPGLGDTLDIDRAVENVTTANRTQRPPGQMPPKPVEAAAGNAPRSADLGDDGERAESWVDRVFGGPDNRQSLGMGLVRMGASIAKGEGIGAGIAAAADGYMRHKQFMSDQERAEMEMNLKREAMELRKQEAAARRQNDALRARKLRAEISQIENALADEGEGGDDLNPLRDAGHTEMKGYEDLWDYAVRTGDTELLEALRERIKEFANRPRDDALLAGLE